MNSKQRKSANLGTYNIYVNGQAYSGETEEVEDADAPAMRRGWSHHCPRTRNVLAFGGKPLDIVCSRNLKSEIDRLFNRDIPIKELIIKRID